MKEHTPEQSLQNAIQASEEIERRIDRGSPKEIATDARTLGIGQLFIVLAQHHRSIRILIQAGDVDASARALLRPLLETGYRAAHLKYVASPQECETLLNGDKNFPSLNKSMAENLSKASGKNLYEKHISDLEMLHDLTHSGAEQMTRHYSSVIGVRPQRDVAECAQIMERAVGFTATMMDELLPVLREEDRGPTPAGGGERPASDR